MLAVVGVIILVTQAGICVARFETGYMLPLTFGDTHQDLSQIQQYLTVDRSVEGSAVRAFGTLGSPGSTVRLCMMMIPFALFLCVPNTMFRMRFVFVALTAFGILGLVLTFTRVYYITTSHSARARVFDHVTRPRSAEDDARRNRTGRAARLGGGGGGESQALRAVHDSGGLGVRALASVPGGPQR